MAQFVLSIDNLLQPVSETMCDSLTSAARGSTFIILLALFPIYFSFCLDILIILQLQ